MSAQPRSTTIAPAPASARTRSRAAEPDRDSARILSAIALASMAAGAINIAAAATVGRGSAQNLAFFTIVAAAQLLWGAVALVRAPRWWLVLGAAGNLLVVATWVASRTVGLPAGVDAGGQVLPARFPDTLATVLEAVVVLGAAALLIWRRSPARAAAQSWGVTSAAAVVAGALTLSGVLAQAGTTGSSSPGPTHNGPGVHGPAYPGGNTGGANTGGGSYGY